MVFSKLFDHVQSTRQQQQQSDRPRKAVKPPRPRKKQKQNNDTTSCENRRGRDDRSLKPKKKRSNPSPEALDFSKQLQQLARQKLLHQALDLYWNTTFDRIRDEHHACIIVDCCSRCGDIKAAESIVNKLEAVQKGIVNVETQTALLKGYVHAGKMVPAMRLFRKICASSQVSNVRTLNTLLRGCMWTAAAAAPCDDGSSNKNSTIITGGVVTSEQAWALYKETFPRPLLDTSSYEYSISLLCQSLHVEQANVRIDKFLSQYNIRAKGKASFVGGDQTSLETLAVVYLGMARAYAMLGQSNGCWTSSQRSLNALKASRVLLLSSTDESAEHSSSREANNNNTDNSKQGAASGGKRSWRQSNDEKGGRAFSNLAFRKHRLSELEAEVCSLLKSRGKNGSAPSVAAVAEHMRHRLLYFAGGGTTGCDHTKELFIAKESYLTSAWLSFGLSQFASHPKPIDFTTDQSILSSVDVAKKCGLSNTSALHTDGTINFNTVFKNGSLPIDIEIGAGFGSWIVEQARANISRNFFAVELRADRVSQIFSRASLGAAKPLDNICVVGSECGHFLRERVKASSISTIFANHPEPPTQTYGAHSDVLKDIVTGRNEPAHMLSSKTILEMGKCLKRGGRIVVVSDNRIYLTRMLAATCTFVVRKKNSALCSVEPKKLKDSSLRHTERYSNCIDLYERIPNHEGSSKGTSYFDRLWRTGAGSHSEKRSRFVLVLERT